MRILRIRIQFRIRIPNTGLHEIFKEYSKETLTEFFLPNSRRKIVSSYALSQRNE
jgi:hypothetical protein